MMETKRCSRCGETKDTDCFYRIAASSDHLHWWCISCCRAYKKTDANRAADRERKRFQKWKRQMEANLDAA